MTHSFLLSISLLSLVTGIFYLIRGKKLFLRIFFPLVCFLFSLLSGITGISVTGYKSVSREETIATVHAEKEGELGLLYVKFPEEEGENIYIFKGEKWMVSVNLLRWKRWLNFTGLKPLYKVKEIGGYPFPDSPVSRWIWSHLLEKGYLHPFLDVLSGKPLYSEEFGKEVILKITESGFILSTR